MFYQRVNILLLCLFIIAPVSQGCDLAIQEEDKVIWFIKTEAKQKRYYYAALPMQIDFQLYSLGDLKKERFKPLGQNNKHMSYLPDEHGILYVISSEKEVNSLLDYQVVETRKAEGRKGFSPYSDALQSSFKEFDDEQGNRVCRWEW